MMFPDKLQKQLDDFFKGKSIDLYYGYTPSHHKQFTQNIGLTTCKDTVSMTIHNYNKITSDEQRRLKYLYDLEKEVMELRKLKESITNIKSVLGEIK